MSDDDEEVVCAVSADWAEAVHVYPVDDTHPHIVSGAPCPCQPEVQYEDDGMIILHRSFDHRERFETAYLH